MVLDHRPRREPTRLKHAGQKFSETLLSNRRFKLWISRPTRPPTPGNAAQKRRDVAPSTLAPAVRTWRQFSGRKPGSRSPVGAGAYNADALPGGRPVGGQRRYSRKPLYLSIGGARGPAALATTRRRGSFESRRGSSTWQSTASTHRSAGKPARIEFRSDSRAAYGAGVSRTTNRPAATGGRENPYGSLPRSAARQPPPVIDLVDTQVAVEEESVWYCYRAANCVGRVDISSSRIIFLSESHKKGNVAPMPSRTSLESIGLSTDTMTSLQ